jgi:hypothetical protein
MKRVSGCITHTIVTGTLVLWIGTAAAVVSCLGPVGINAPGRGTITETELSDSLSETGGQEEVDESGFIVLDPPVENHVQWKSRMTMINNLSIKATEANPMKFLVPVAEDVVIELDAHGTGNNPMISRENVVVYIKGVSGHTGTFQLKSSALGNLLTAGDNQQLIIKDLILRGHDANNHALVGVVRGQFHMKSGSDITGNYNTSTNGGGINLDGGNLIVGQGCKISGNEVSGVDKQGGGICAENNATLVIAGIIGGTTSLAEGNIANLRGGGIYLSGGSLTLESEAAICYNSTDKDGGFYDEGYGGGGVYATDGAVVIMKGESEVRDNSSWYGGGIYLENGSSLVMEDSSVIKSHASYRGGGIMCGGITENTIVMKGNSKIGGEAEADGNNAEYGGAIDFWNGSNSLEMKDNAAIAYNNSIWGGGGIDVAHSNVTITMTGDAVIRNNTSGNGGGINVNHATVITLSGYAKIGGAGDWGNMAASQGGGINFVPGPGADNSVLHIKENAEISYNQSIIGGGVYYPDTAPPLIAEGAEKIINNTAESYDDIHPLSSP